MSPLDVELKYVQLLKYPQDASTIAQLSLEEKICWYSGQDPRRMVYLAQDARFVRFWKMYYMWPLKLKRFVFKIKALLRI